jgi:TRAP-type C4-dicarboxylate transport system substrate-binding protein
MKRLSYLLIALLVIVLSGSILCSCTAKKTEPVTLRLGMAITAQSPQSIELGQLATRFTERAGPDYSMGWYPAQTLVPFPDSLDAVRTGAAEMMGWPPSAFASDDARLGVVEIPFITDSPEANAAAAKQFENLISGVLEENFNQKVIGAFSVCSNELISMEPIKTLEDWKGLLCQSLSPSQGRLIAEFGGSQVSIPFPDAYTSLEKGVVEAVMIAPSGMYTFNLQEVASYVTTAFMSPGITTITINLDVWNKMPKKTQDILAEEVRKSTDTLNQLLIDDHYSSLDNLAAAGMEIYALPKAERDKWKAAAQPAIDELLSKTGDTGQKAMKIASDINKQYPYHPYPD